MVDRTSICIPIVSKGGFEEFRSLALGNDDNPIAITHRRAGRQSLEGDFQTRRIILDIELLNRCFDYFGRIKGRG